MRILSVLLFAPALAACGSPDSDSGRTSSDENIRSRSFAVGASDNDTGKPIGGGEDYGDWVGLEGAVTVTTARDLLEAITSGTPGTKVFVPGDTVIDLTDRNPDGSPNEHSITVYVIPAGVTLFSDRGKNGSLGGLLFSENLVQQPRFVVHGDKVRITGLRIQGPDPGEFPPIGCFTHDAYAIKVEASAGVRIDNNEMYAWPYAAVWNDLNDLGDVTVSHNHIHHNLREVSAPVFPQCMEPYGMGYAVQADHSDTVIEANLFDHNRHDVTSGGRPASEGGETNYWARFNLVLKGGTQSAFDVHGGADLDPPPDSVAGTRIEIRNNTVLAGQGQGKAVLIRGTPEILAHIHMNEFFCPDEDACIDQINSLGHYLAENNVHNLPLPKAAWNVSMSGMFPFKDRAGPGSYWAFRRLENSTSSAMSGFAVHDFNGDGKADVFRATGSTFEISFAAKSDFLYQRNSDYPLQKLAFADFNNDGHTDVFAVSNGEWWVSLNGSGEWGDADGNIGKHLNASGYDFADFRIADLDGNGRADVLRADGSQWLWSKDGTQVWTPRNFTLAGKTWLQDTRFGKFTGNDDQVDVFYATGTEWVVSNAGASMWQHLNWSATTVENLRFADFDGDGVTDVFCSDAGQWKVSFGGTGPWTKFAVSDFPLSALKFGDVNGDGRADVLVADPF